MRTPLARLVLAGLLIFTAACSSGDSDAEPDATSTTTTTEAPPLPPTEIPDDEAAFTLAYAQGVLDEHALASLEILEALRAAGEITPEVEDMIAANTTEFALEDEIESFRRLLEGDFEGIVDSPTAVTWTAQSVHVSGICMGVVAALDTTGFYADEREPATITLHFFQATEDQIDSGLNTMAWVIDGRRLGGYEDFNCR